MSEEEKVACGHSKEPEGDDPMELVGHEVPGGDPETLARCFIEEYALIGMGEAEILELFRQPVYRTHELYRERGEAWVRGLIRSVLGEAGPLRVSVMHFHHIGGCDA